MTSIKLKRLILFISLFATIFSNSQEFQGKAYYTSKTSVDMSNFGRPNMTEEQRKRMENRLKNMFQKNFVLAFNRVESVYKLEEKLEAPTQGGNGRFGAIMSGAIDGEKYKNVQTKMVLQELELFGKLFLVKDELPDLKWTMTSETKQIGGYTCYKATATKTWQDFDATALRRPPNSNDNNEGTKEETKDKEVQPDVEVIAWYTMQIPVNQGPGDYWGLPGLILEVNTDTTTILCSKIVLNPEDKANIKQPTKGKEITKEAYVEIATKKFQEMRENFRRGGQRGGGGRR
ncbi:GLPGLI family protein [Hyunsoonleella ulvae]|uniref:GLPGLI family protein n=1 Tax=Hyunsoonleella ulvae TaxID=2799948 RepID=UPI001939DB7D|nr:GLPGLI family protein [Hyunsoonleella ulvae]